MANIQTQFNTYHNDIKLSTENEILIEKRDILKNNLEANLPNDAPKIDKYLLQGSYAIYTGINPPNNDYDIDVGVVFDCKKEDYPNPMKLKEIVKEALTRFNREPVIKNPCITVQYSLNGENTYHVDMPVYVKRVDNNGYDLAWGKSASSKEWKHSDPEGLVTEINNVSNDESERAQFRRIVKYLKSWKSKKITAFKLPSIGLTLAIKNNFKREISYYDNQPNDLVAMLSTVKQILNNFSYVNLDENYQCLYRYKVFLPVIPCDDVFSKLTDKQMTEFKTKLESLKNALEEAHKEERPEKACEILGKHFEDFPIPSPEETAKIVQKSMNNTGSSS